MRYRVFATWNEAAFVYVEADSQAEAKEKAQLRAEEMDFDGYGEHERVFDIADDDIQEESEEADAQLSIPVSSEYHAFTPPINKEWMA